MLSLTGCFANPLSVTEPNHDLSHLYHACRINQASHRTLGIAPWRTLQVISASRWRSTRPEGGSAGSTGLSTSQTQAEKLVQERKLEEAVSRKVIERSIRVHVDGPWPNTWPGEILVKATKELCKEVGGEELTSFKIDRTLENIVIRDGWGAFWWDASNKKRHLTLNSEEWMDKNRKKTRPPSTGSAIGDLSGVYGDADR